MLPGFVDSKPGSSNPQNHWFLFQRPPSSAYSSSKRADQIPKNLRRIKVFACNLFCSLSVHLGATRSPLDTPPPLPYCWKERTPCPQGIARRSPYPEPRRERRARGNRPCGTRTIPTPACNVGVLGHAPLARRGAQVTGTVHGSREDTVSIDQPLCSKPVGWARRSWRSSS
jgi:hypothetical protein